MSHVRARHRHSATLAAIRHYLRAGLRVVRYPVFHVLFTVFFFHFISVLFTVKKTLFRKYLYILQVVKIIVLLITLFESVLTFNRG